MERPVSSYLLREQRSLEHVLVERLLAAPPNATRPEQPPSALEGFKPLVCILGDNDATARKLAEALAADGRWNTMVAGQAIDILALAPEPDAVLIEVRRLARLNDLDPMFHARLSRPCRLVMALDREEMIGARDLLPIIDTWVFRNLTGIPVGDQLPGALEGHAILPADLTTRHGLDAVRLKLSESLSPLERTVLRALAAGPTNNDLADQIGGTESGVKFAIHTVLTKLHFRNRTEAGIFAYRHAAALAGSDPQGGERALDRSI
jgi:DNA-binding CsgD family transcriptional regulator